MEIRRLNRNDLKHFIESEEYESMPVIPITKHRALSHIANPRASEDDILLIIAYENNKMVGYLGVLADYLYDQDSIYKVGWLSASWVDPCMRRKGIAGKLLREALDAWNNHILVADWVPNSFGVYQKSGAFRDLVCRDGIRAYLRFNLREMIPIGGTFFGKSFLRTSESVLNLFNSVRLHYHNKVLRKSYPPFERAEGIDDEGERFMNRWKRSEMFRRGKKELEWILKYPWILEKSPINPQPDKRFHFSSVCNEFRKEIIKVRGNRNEIIALLMVTIRNKNLQIPYLYYLPEQKESVAQFIYRYMIDNKIKDIMLFDTGLSNYFVESWAPFYIIKKKKLPYIITKDLAIKLRKDGKIIQDGDGERAFT